MTYRVLFILGLLFECIGQILLSNGLEFIYAQKPIDFAHWLLLLGVVFLIPQLFSFPEKLFVKIGIPVVLTGIVCIIGMCVLDFVWWSQPNQDVRVEFATHLSKFPSIWKPFITTGPNFLNAGLLLMSVPYFKKSKIGFILVALATLIVFFMRFIPNRLIYAYFIYAIGFSFLLLTNPLRDEH